MRFIRVQGETYNEQSRLREKQLTGRLEEGGTYLIAESSTEDFLPVYQPEHHTADLTLFGADCTL